MDTSGKVLIVTGCENTFFPNLSVLIGSWLSHMGDFEIAVCDFGLSEIQKHELSGISGLRILSSDEKIETPFAGKTLIFTFLGEIVNQFNAIMWIDADAFFNSRLPDILSILHGYDILIDSHIQSIGEISDRRNIEVCGLRKDDSYFSAGFWIAQPGNFLKVYEEIGTATRDRYYFWEADAFVSAIYREKLKIRTISGAVWHCRGKTSLDSCVVRGLTAYHLDQPIYVIHANAYYWVKKNGRRILYRPTLAKLQQHYLNIYNLKLGLNSKQNYPANYFQNYFKFLSYKIKTHTLSIIKTVLIFTGLFNVLKRFRNRVLSK